MNYINYAVPLLLIRLYFELIYFILLLIIIRLMVSIF